MISGIIKIHVNDNEYGLAENDPFYMGRGSGHRMINLEYQSIVLEISTGNFDEGVIVRPKRHLQHALNKISFFDYCICFFKTVIKNKITKYK